MNNKIKVLLSGILLITIVAACQSSTPATQPGIGGPLGGPMGTPNPEMMTQIASNPQMQPRIGSGGPGGMGLPGEQPPQNASATPSPEPTEMPEPTATATPETMAAEQAARAYFATLESGDFAGAASLVSSFSRTVTGLASSEVVAELTSQKTNGRAWSDLEIVDSQVFDSKTVLVHVTYTAEILDPATGKMAKTSLDELWPFRLEVGQWRYNWGNLIDYKTLGGDPQQVGGLSMKPVQMMRFSDKIRLVLLAQNNTDGAIVIGRSNQVLATFHFAGKSVDAVQTKYFFDAYRSYPDIYIDVPGFYEGYPDSVELVKFTNTVTPPWFTFGLVD